MSESKPVKLPPITGARRAGHRHRRALSESAAGQPARSSDKRCNAARALRSRPKSKKGKVLPALPPGMSPQLLPEMFPNAKAYADVF